MMVDNGNDKSNDRSVGLEPTFGSELDRSTGLEGQIYICLKKTMDIPSV